ncbi:MAG TPA: hypothetical protein VEZ17_13630 [Chitinophagaceae bacterium]|jgi:hypothetical protein|nr:hypothetical protein [Chitinophagaceae bacterium]
MKKSLLSLLIFVTACYYNSLLAQDVAQDYKLGLGIRLSNASPTLNNSISLKYFVDEGTALEGLLSFGSRFGIGGLYEKHKPLNYPGIKWYYGAGAYLGAENRNTYFGPTGVIGLDYKFETIPLNLSLDWKPELDILPRIAFIPDAFGLSARFTLK